MRSILCLRQSRLPAVARMNSVAPSPIPHFLTLLDALRTASFHCCMAMSPPRRICPRVSLCRPLQIDGPIRATPTWRRATSWISARIEICVFRFISGTEQSYSAYFSSGAPHARRPHRVLAVSIARVTSSHSCSDSCERCTASGWAVKSALCRFARSSLRGRRLHLPSSQTPGGPAPRHRRDDSAPAGGAASRTDGGGSEVWRFQGLEGAGSGCSKVRTGLAPHAFGLLLSVTRHRPPDTDFPRPPPLVPCQRAFRIGIPKYSRFPSG